MASLVAKGHQNLPIASGIEVRLGLGKVDAGADSPLRIASHFDTDTHRKPGFLAVITGCGYAYRRPDDVLVVPIRALVP